MKGVQRLPITENNAGQRIDNYLVKLLKGVPRSHLYSLIRKGQVRVNGKRVQAPYKLQQGDEVRVPPVRYSEQKGIPALSSSLKASLEAAILYEDPALIVLNKPAALASHGGSGVQYGVIEALRALRGQTDLALVHRLDQGTSGCLLVAKKRSMLRWLQEQLRMRRCIKRYWVIVEGDVPSPKVVEAPLQRYTLANGERRVRVSPSGQAAKTTFTPLLRFGTATVLEALLESGRTHQIRVHCCSIGTPVLGDEKYGSSERGLATRLCLHARSLEVELPTGKQLCIEAPLPGKLVQILKDLSKQSGKSLDILGIIGNNSTVG